MSLSACVLGLHLLSAHVSPGYETVTPGAYVQCPSGLTAGAYRNSLGRPSVYAGHTWHRGPFALSAIALTGYPLAPIVPALVPSVAFKLTQHTSARASLVLAPKGGSAVHFSWEYRP